MNDHALQLLEFDRVAASIAARASSPAARAALVAWRPLADPAERARETGWLAEAIHRIAEPGEWVVVGSEDLGALLDAAASPAGGLDGPALRLVAGWLEAARHTREAWRDDAARARHPGLAALADTLPALDALERALTSALDEDGRVRDTASPALRRARTEVREGERALEKRLEDWAKGFGAGTYVTRHADRFVAMVPGAGFPRRLGIVHDVSASGHSLFVEPLEACEANNRLLEQRAVAAEEERRILLELARSVLDAEPALRSLAETLTRLDTLAARARWARRVNGLALAPAGDALRLEHARHPLLVETLGDATIPLDLELAADARILLVSGPNMGGKTVVLKTVGLAVALAHAALPVPAAEGSRIPEIDAIHVDLGDEQSLVEGLSTFAAHLRTLGVMAAEASPRTLLLCDELGAGTDPDEGAALAQALVERFVERRAWGVLTTHLGSLKRTAGALPGVVHGAMEFDAAAAAPRYRLLMGVPGASRALATAERLGFDRELLERARSYTSESARAVERLLHDLEVLRGRLEGEREGVAAERERLVEAERAHRAAEEHVRESLTGLRRRLTAESEAVLARARELWQTVHREARRADKQRASAESLREELKAVERDLDAVSTAAAAAEAAAMGSPAEERPVELTRGAQVHVRDLDVDAEIVDGPDAEGRVQLRRGGWTIQSHVSRLAAPAGHGPGRGDESVRAPAKPRGGASWEVSDTPAPLEVDVRGLDSDEAIRALDQGLDRAALAGLGEVRIIHGLGRGVLRAAVERHLRGHPQVASSRMGELREGGRGVTVARLR